MRRPQKPSHTLAERVAAKLASRPDGTRAASASGSASAPARMLGLRQARPGETLMLMPGELYFGHQARRVRTLLGSCVALTLWHPVRRVGGMCHYLLPGRQRPEDAPPDGRYGDEAVAALVDALRGHGCQGSEFTAHLYGGADTLSEHLGIKLNIGERNIECGWTLADRHGFFLESVDVGDRIPRTVTLDLRDGTVECRRGRREILE